MIKNATTNLSAGLLMCSLQDGDLRFFLVHPGGPYWKNKNEGAWGIPKGLPDAGENMVMTAQREFFEETGIVPIPPFHPLGSSKLKSGKTIHAWAFLGEWSHNPKIISNKITIEWPPHSHNVITVPEADRGEWMSFEKASVMMNPGQLPFLERARNIYQQPVLV